MQNLNQTRELILSKGSEFTKALQSMAMSLPGEIVTDSKYIELFDVIDTCYADICQLVVDLIAIVEGLPKDYNLDAWLAWSQEKKNMEAQLQAVTGLYQALGQQIDDLAANSFDMPACSTQAPPIDLEEIKNSVYANFSKDEGEIVDRVLKCIELEISA